MERTNTFDERGVFEYGLQFTMFASLEDHLAGWRDNIGIGFPGNKAVFICLPIVALFVTFWIKCFMIETEKRRRLFFLIPIAVLPYNAIAFLLFFDFGRWITMLLAVQFMLAFYFISLKDKTVLEVVHSGARVVKRHAFLITLACLLMAFLGPVHEIRVSESVRSISSTVRVLFGSFKGL